jgi:hypothetical protein
MKPDYEKQLEAEIDARLKELGELAAPATLASRVMRTIEQRAARPWHQRSWETWPRGLQVASFAVLTVLFAGLCVGAWNLANGGVGWGSGTLFGGLSRSLATIFSVIDVLKSALVLAVRELGTGVIAGFIAMLALAWAVCIGLGTMYVRLGMQPAVNER